MAEKHHYYFDTEQQRACPTCGSVMASYQTMDEAINRVENGIYYICWNYKNEIPVTERETLED